MAARKLLQRAAALSPAQAAEPGFDLKAYEAATREPAAAPAATSAATTAAPTAGAAA